MLSSESIDSNSNFDSNNAMFNLNSDWWQSIQHFYFMLISSEWYTVHSSEMIKF